MGIARAPQRIPIRLPVDADGRGGRGRSSLAARTSESSGPPPRRSCRCRAARRRSRPRRARRRPALGRGPLDLRGVLGRVHARRPGAAAVDPVRARRARRAGAALRRSSATRSTTTRWIPTRCGSNSQRRRRGNAAFGSWARVSPPHPTSAASKSSATPGAKTTDRSSRAAAAAGVVRARSVSLEEPVPLERPPRCRRRPPPWSPCFSQSARVSSSIGRQALARERGVQAGQLLRGPGVEVLDDVAELRATAPRALDLRLRRRPS